MNYDEMRQFQCKRCGIIGYAPEGAFVCQFCEQQPPTEVTPAAFQVQERDGELVISYYSQSELLVLLVSLLAIMGPLLAVMVGLIWSGWGVLSTFIVGVLVFFVCVFAVEKIPRRLFRVMTSTIIVRQSKDALYRETNSPLFVYSDKKRRLELRVAEIEKFFFRKAIGLQIKKKTEEVLPLMKLQTTEEYLYLEGLLRKKLGLLSPLTPT